MDPTAAHIAFLRRINHGFARAYAWTLIVSTAAGLASVLLGRRFEVGWLSSIVLGATAWIVVLALLRAGPVRWVSSRLERHLARWSAGQDIGSETLDRWLCSDPDLAFLATLRRRRALSSRGRGGRDSGSDEPDQMERLR